MTTQAPPFLEILTAAFSTGEHKSYAISGGYFEILDCSYPVTVKLIGLHGELRGIMRNAEASFYLKGGDYSTITIESPNAQVVRFAFGTSEAGTRRTSGVVQVVDSSKSRTIAGQAFIASFNVAAAVGVNHSTVLWNPPGSGKNIYIQRLRVSVTVAAVYGSGHITSLGTGLALNPSAPVHKRLGAPPSFECYQTAAGNFNGTAPSMNAVFTASLAANQVDVGDLYEPVLIEPGAGFRVFVASANVGLISGIELIEEAI
ncbi:hypothetical protein [Hydrogenophaga laconesensis]|uniref:Uncharacterized protein n=1 Tax=Hydrogenophaga laconesensis TaxID=1805971 RepID=A0ABU1VDL5_9BURK|nr:hypothetical protein [Hydrogenophaga laconesensis]MDR7095532.1 hypothetical protein [Hydrogenophaga laconesensis]